MENFKKQSRFRQYYCLFSPFVARRALIALMLLGTLVQANASPNHLEAIAQNKETNQSNIVVKGKVVDQEGEALPIVTVLIQGTQEGVTTDLDGNYEIQVPSSESFLVFRYTGMETQTIQVGNQSIINVTLGMDVAILEGVVVTALGIERKVEALSYNAQKVSGEALLKNKDANFVNALSGKVAGVTINSSSSGIGGASKVVMRGTKSIMQSSNTLYVIDGIPVFNFGTSGDEEFGSSGATEAIADMNPEDIESITVLTGAAAAALYGSNGANGAILITTKKGKKGAPSLSLNTSTQVLRAFVTPEFQNSYGTGDVLNDSDAPDRSWGKKLNEANRTDYDPSDDFLKIGVVQSTNLSYSTGTETNQTYISAGAINSEGILPNNEYNRYNFTFRNTSQALNDKLRLDIGGSYIKQDDRNMTNQGIYSNPLVTAYLFPRGDDWNDTKMYERYDPTRKIYTQHWPQSTDEFVGQNPYWAAYRNTRENKKSRYMANVGLSYDVFDWLNFAARARIDNSTIHEEKKLYASSHTTITEGSDNGFYGIKKDESKQTYADVLMNINKDFDNEISFHANIGASYLDMKSEGLKTEGGIKDDLLPNVFNVFQLDDKTAQRSQVGWHDQTQSVFASAEVGYKNAVYLTLTGRSDWDSRLVGEKSKAKSFFYPSIGTSFVLSEIFTMPEQIEYVKIRTSYAEVGTSFPRFIANKTYQYNEDTDIWADTDLYPIYDLKPERTKSFEVGLNTRLLSHFNLDISYYRTNTYNQTFQPLNSTSSGYGNLFIQSGNIQNEGIELALGYETTIGDLNWSSNFTLTTNKNKVVELADNYNHPIAGIITKDELNVGGLGFAQFIAKKGGSLGELYSTVDLARDSEGDILVDEAGNVRIDKTAHKTLLGSVLPKANLGWKNDFKYKRFNFGFLITARLGGIVYSETQATLDRYGVSKASGDARDNGGVIVNGNDVVNTQKWYNTIGKGIPQYYTYSATNVRLQEISFGYDIPKKFFFNVADVSLSIVGKNLFMLYCKAPFDPESVATTGSFYQGIDRFMMPSLSSIGFNARIKF